MGSLLLSEFATLAYLAPLDEAKRANEAKHVSAGLRHFARHLKRQPGVDDLTTDALTALCTWLLEQGRAAATCDRYRAVLMRIGRIAHEQGFLASAPRVRRLRARWNKSKWTPYTRAELNKIFGAARTMPGEAAPGFAAWDWWPALLLTILDIQLSAPPLLALPANAVDLNSGRLKSGLFIYGLHPQTVSALCALGTTPRDRLFPWALDGASPPFCQLYYHFRELLWRAGVASLARGIFERLRQTAIADPEAIDKISLHTRFIPRQRPHRHPRRRPESGFRRAASSEAAPTGFGKSNRKRAKRRHGHIAAAPFGFPPDNKETRAKRKRYPDLHLIGPIPGQENQTMLAFFNNVYAPRRFADCSKDTVLSYRTAVRRLNEFCSCVVSLSSLSDDLIESFLAWLAACGYPPATRKRMRGELLCIWRFAWRKKFVETQPRDIDQIKVPKTVPECWSVEEVGRLLAVAAKTTGHVNGFRAGVYWCALLMLMYDTGLRVGAVMQLRMRDANLETGWVKARWESQKQKADQMLPIHRDTVALLLQMGDPSRELLFPFPFKSNQALTERLRLLLQRAGLPSGKRDLFHKLRRTNGTYVADAAGEEAAMKQLGHSGINVTRRYIDPSKLSLPRIADVMQRPAWKPAILIGVDPQMEGDTPREES